eukprot:CAMPEP_0119553126 /NCGR_PEP_ID=MMETSP1352-20130426/5956_1 /TAXON_ID=265584 /ORGANISM="Stauroneis constricta, Strain CCMP1120" /LENGTH=171 /DNA_ID=CAMNT_0007599477 /DNA_START=145 /DNA_END=657 /DNA_ORIENTATION=+
MAKSPSKHTKKQQQQQQQPERRVMKNIPIRDVVASKGITRAIQTFRKKKAYKAQQTARSLRQYRKVMKQEGYDAGKGAGRKRHAASTHEEDDEPKITDSTAGDGAETKPKRKPKYNPYQKAMKQKIQHEEERKIKQQQYEEQDKLRKQKLRQRKQRTRQIMTQRTRRGQPI